MCGLDADQIRNLLSKNPQPEIGEAACAELFHENDRQLITEFWDVGQHVRMRGTKYTNDTYRPCCKQGRVGLDARHEFP